MKPSTYQGKPITMKDKMRCVNRELSMRRKVYPRWVREGRMTREEADREIATMEAVLADYQKAKNQLALFKD